MAMINKFTMQGIFALVLGSSLAACGSAEPGAEDGEEVGQGALELQSFAAPFRDTSTMRGSTTDWAYCHGKASCAAGEVVSGISQSPSDHQGRAALCKEGDAAKFTGNVKATLLLAAADQRRASRLGDWAPGFHKLECGLGEYVSGVSENASYCDGNNKFHGVQCAQGVGFNEDTACTTRVFDAADTRGSTASEDWDVGGYKGECAIDEHVAGVSVSPSTGAPHSILCCRSSGPAPSMLPNQSFWGTGALREFPAKNAAECYTPCLEDASCSGGTYNAAKANCWLRTGSATVGSGISSDAAFTVSSSLRDAYYQSLMHTGRGFWGTGALREFTTTSAAACYQACFNDSSCTGGTFNLGKRNCWLRTGNTNIGSGIPSDSGFEISAATRDEALQSLVERFAPRLRFDGDTPNYPMSAQTFYDAAVAVPQSGRVDNTDITSLSTGGIPTYTQATACSGQVRIQYWFFYGHQPTCDGTSGDHNGDWEKIMVTLSEDRSQIAAVTYWMHGYSYTRLPKRGNVAIEDSTHPVVYVGKNSHASFYNQGGSSHVCWPVWEEWRNNSSGAHLDTWNNLVSLAANDEPWVIRDRQGNFMWGADGVSTHPTQAGPSCNMPAATWKSGVETWSHSDCEYGDTDMGTFCSAGGDTYTYAWTLGVTDRGLIKPN